MSRGLSAAVVFIGVTASCGPRRPPGYPASDGRGAPASTAAGASNDNGTATPIAPAPGEPVAMGRSVQLTLYFLAEEPCPDGGGAQIVACDGALIAHVSPGFEKSAAMQGSARLCDGRVVNIKRIHPICFGVLSSAYPYGATATGHPATPMRSIAVDPSLFPLGRWYFIPELVGLTVSTPDRGTWVHDGCVYADDRGGGVHGAHIDLFTGTRAVATAIDAWWRASLATRGITIATGEGRCHE